MATIGIDLGTTYSKAARCMDGRPEIIHLEGDPTLPSVVGLQNNGKIAIGRTAKRNQARNPQNTVVEVKRQMGKPVTVRLGEKAFTPQEVSAMILRRIKDLAEAELGEPVTGAVISCPAYFKDPARSATKEAGDIAGLNVLKIINEPTAAAYAYGVMQGNDDKDKLFVVYDLGGGTFDVTAIRMVAGSLEVVGTGGDPELGGGNFDDRIADWMLGHLDHQNPGYVAALNDARRAALRMRLKYHAEEGKIQLCNSTDERPEFRFQITQVDSYEGRPVVFTEALTRDAFEGMIRDLLDHSLKWVDEALKVPKEKHNYTEKDVTAILLVGGSTRVPLVRRILEARFPGTPVWGWERGINPDEIVALGASIVAAAEDPDSDQIAPAQLVDVTGHTLSVALFDERRQREILSPIIPKETPIPCAVAIDFLSMGRGQRYCRVKVFQGEGVEIDQEQVTMIGEFIAEITPIEAPTPLRFGLDLDANGILLAHATDLLSGRKVVCKIDYKDSARMNSKELAARKAALEAQMNAVIGQAANPLGGGGPAALEAPLLAPLGQNPWSEAVQAAAAHAGPIMQAEFPGSTGQERGQKPRSGTASVAGGRRPHDVFISYASKDKDVADRACATLEAAGVQCWMAPRDIPAGQEWAEAIVHAIRRSKAFVMIFSANSNASKQVRREVHLADERGCPVIAWRIENILPVDGLNFFLGSVHWLDALTPPVGQHLGQLLDSVKACLGLES